jgi:sodium-dependent dicarboxylate transporter 2/3/5
MTLNSQFLGVKETGLSNIIGESLSGLNGFPTFVLQIICAFTTMVVTNVCSNTVSASIFLPIVANLAQETGVNPLCLMLIGKYFEVFMKLILKFQ